MIASPPSRFRPRWSAGLFGWSLARVDGDSMAPTLAHGDYVLARRRSAEVGDVVLIRHPALGPIVKRITARERGGRYRVAGDNNTLSTAGDAIGALDAGAISGVVGWRVAPGGVRRLRHRPAVAETPEAEAADARTVRYLRRRAP